ncbi:MAG: TetR-like C-terminal domain-containing protein [Adlercreutzia equolifaciens]
MRAGRYVPWHLLQPLPRQGRAARRAGGRGHGRPRCPAGAHAVHYPGGHAGLPRDGPPAVPRELFDYLREQSDFLHAVLGPGGDVRFGPRLREAVCENLVQNILHEKYRDNPTVFVEYYVAFYAAAYLGIIAHWIERGCPESSETMARIATRLLFIKPGESIEL